MEKKNNSGSSKIFLEIFSSELITLICSNILVSILVYKEIYALAFINIVIGGYIISVQSGDISSNKFIINHLEDGLNVFNELTGGKIKTNLLNNTSKRIAIEEALKNAVNGSGEVFVVALLVTIVDLIVLVFKGLGAF